MSALEPRILVTGAGGQLGRLVVDGLLGRTAPGRIVATVRDLAAAGDIAALGVEVRRADYDDPATLDAAFAGIDRLLLVSSSNVGHRVPQHRNAVDAARRAGAGLLVYTSLLNAGASPLALAAEHNATEELIRGSGVPFALLRNGWYTENYTGSVPMALANGALLGSAGEGRIASAARADYAEAAVAVLTSGDDQAGRVYELAGDDAYTLTDLAAEVSRQAGAPVAYRELAEADYKAVLLGVGLPEPLAALYADSDTGAAKGGLFDDRRQLSALIGRPTTPMRQSVRAALAA